MVKDLHNNKLLLEKCQFANGGVLLKVVDVAERASFCTIWTPWRISRPGAGCAVLQHMPRRTVRQKMANTRSGGVEEVVQLRCQLR